MNIQHMTGIEGQVELTGYGRAVAASFLRWTLERRGETGSGEPIWNLRASLSYQKESMLLNERMNKTIRIKSQLGEYIVEPLPGATPKVEHTTQYVIEGVTLCRVAQP